MARRANARTIFNRTALWLAPLIAAGITVAATTAGAGTNRPRLVPPSPETATAIVTRATVPLPPPPLGTVGPQSADEPQFGALPDPEVLADGGVYYLYGTDTYFLTDDDAGVRLPIHVTTSLAQPPSPERWAASTIEGMPVRAAWAKNNFVWAPTVARLAEHQYVAFFAAVRNNAPSPAAEMCIGRAVAASPIGPFLPEPQPFSCGLDDVSGAIDPALFRAPDGRWYLHAAFTNTPGWIHVYALDDRIDQARTPAGTACCPSERPLVAAIHPWEKGWLENPAMTYDTTTGTYLLAYSAGGPWWGARYATGLARCSSPIGDCTASPDGPWLAQSTTRTGTGGLSFFRDFDGSTKVIFASFAAGHEWLGARAATVAELSFGIWTPTTRRVTAHARACDADASAHLGQVDTEMAGDNVALCVTLLGSIPSGR